VAIGPEYRSRGVSVCASRVSGGVSVGPGVSGVSRVVREGGGCGGCRGGRRGRRGRRWGARALAASLEGRGLGGVSDGTCVSVLGCRLGVRSGIFTGSNTAAVRIGILDARLFPIQLPNAFSGRGSQRCIGGPRSLPSLRSHSLGGLRPVCSALIGREVFPFGKTVISGPSVLSDSREMGLHEPETSDGPWR
jgi:hypothetical protein